MIQTDLQPIAKNVVRLAQRQGFVVPRDIRAELHQAGLPDTQWKDVVALTRESLHYRQGRYYFLAPVSAPLQQQQSLQQQVARVLRSLIQDHKNRTAQRERRNQDRVDFVQIVKVRTEDGRTLRQLTRDVSPTGIRLVGTRSLLGQKIEVQLTQEDGQPAGTFLVRILWTCAVGDDLYENGGTFLESTKAEE